MTFIQQVKYTAKVINKELKTQGDKKVEKSDIREKQKYKSECSI